MLNKWNVKVKGSSPLLSSKQKEVVRMDEEAVLKTVGRETDLGVRFSLPPQKGEIVRKWKRGGL